MSPRAAAMVRIFGSRVKNYRTQRHRVYYVTIRTIGSVEPYFQTHPQTVAHILFLFLPGIHVVCAAVMMLPTFAFWDIRE